VLFYKPGYYLTHPLEIFKVWEGGMAFTADSWGC
jgi:phosphatidylglycerol:prolipoprotein diacylglycerol transferase